jgi:hypothetical protein
VKESESEEHQNLVRMMANYFKNKKETYDKVKADLKDWPPTDPIGEHIPDVTAIDLTKGKRIVLEAEICETIFDAHTEQQWKAFDQYCVKTDSEFHVVVPCQCNSESGPDAARKREKELKITLHHVWQPKKEEKVS